MATVITSECINCGACEPECPNTAIYQGGMEWELSGQKSSPLAPDIFYIVPDKCTECVGFFDHEACAAVCPVDCCVPDPQRPETETVLIARAKQLHADKEFPAAYPSRFKPGATAARAVLEAAVAPVPSAVAPVAKPATAVAPAVPPAAAPARPAAAPVAAAVSAAPAAAPTAKPVAAAAAAAPAAARPAVVAPGAATEKAAAPAQPAAPSALRPTKTFSGELTMAFDEAVALIATPRPGRSRLPHWARALGQPLLDAWPCGSKKHAGSVEVGQVPNDGFHGGDFEDKQERERRYGEVYSFREQGSGFSLRLEFPRRVPHSSLKDELGVPDEMPDYAYDLALQNGYLVVQGRVEDPNLRKLAAVSPAFPPNFTTHIKLPVPVTGFKHRFVNKTLEVVLVKQ